MARMSFVSHLECALCGRHYDAGQLQGLCDSCQRPLWVLYDLAAVGRTLSKAALRDRAATFWRYTDMLPMRNAANVVSLGETMTPLLETKRLGAHFGVENIWVKDESRLPTGSFKARGMALAISKANEFGVKRVACPTAGNAGGAMASYAARAGMEAYVFMPEDTPSINQKECFLAGAKTFLVNGLITDCGKSLAKAKGRKAGSICRR
jgi:threonine synthase